MLASGLLLANQTLPFLGFKCILVYWNRIWSKNFKFQNGGFNLAGRNYENETDGNGDYVSGVFWAADFEPGF